MKTPLILIGAGGHASVLIDCIRHQSGVEIVGILESNPALLGKTVWGVRVIGTDSDITRYANNEVQLLNGLGSIDVPKHRKSIFHQFKALGYRFYTVIHPTAYVAYGVTLGEGVQIMAGSVVQPQTVIGDNVLVNTRVVIDHECRVGDHVHIAPGTVISGDVSIGNTSHIGTGAVIKQGMTVGSHCVVGAGAVVVNNIDPGSRVAGVPAKRISVVSKERYSEKVE